MRGEAPSTSPGREWFPFRVGEVERALGLCGFVVASLALVDVPAHALAVFTAAFLVVAYLAGLLVYARRGVRAFDFIKDGGLRGEGYVTYFREARKSLFLTHTDDDAPSEELLGLYRTLLGRGVQMRRVVFLRHQDTANWLVRFGEHRHLEQRVVPPERADLLPLSFVVVDEITVVVSVPGYDAIDAGGYASEFVLRHLLVIKDRAVARVFLEMHRHLWERANPLRLLPQAGDPTRS